MEVKKIKDSNMMTKTEYVYHAIKEAILSGEYQENEKLVIRNISDSFNVSDIPVREAMRRLEAEKLVSIVPHVGAVVNSISLKDIEDGVELREILEPWAARLVAENITKEQVERLNSLIEQMDRCIKEKDYQEYGRLNKEFHQNIYDSYGNETLSRIIKEIWEKTERLRGVFRNEPARMKESNKEHKRLVEALAKGDADEAERLIKYQRTLSTKHYLAYLKSLQEAKEASGKEGNGLIADE